MLEKRQASAYLLFLLGERQRATKDIDLVLEGSVENLARAAEALTRFGADLFGSMLNSWREFAPKNRSNVPKCVFWRPARGTLSA